MLALSPICQVSLGPEAIPLEQMVRPGTRQQPAMPSARKCFPVEESDKESLA
jgi:hypothetical protein